MAETTDLEFDYDLNELEESVETQQQSVDVPLSFFVKNKQRLVMLGGVFFVIILVVAGYVLWGKPAKKQRHLLSTTQSFQKGQSNININDDKTAQVKPEKKKRKKIKYVELYTLTGENLAMAVKELSFANISFRTKESGSDKFKIEVDQMDLDQARNLLAVKGMPSNEMKGYALLDDAQTLGVTEFDKRVRFLRALSGELEKAISQFELIEDAKVQIVLPKQRLFSVIQPPVTSAVLIRRMKGSVITDDVVFSIIQLVANAVENLQLENVSVIDTSGIVLSEGLFERMAARKEGDTVRHPKPLAYDEPVDDDRVLTREQAIGQPLIPNYQSISEWFDVKWEFENVLASKAMRQLRGVLPFGSYRVAVSSDIGPIENGEIVDVRRLTVSVVVDQNNDEIYLDQQVKQEVYNTVASAIGYVKGRDSIVLSRADFVLLSNQEKRDLEIVFGLGVWNRSSILLGLGILLGVIGGCIFGYRFYRKQKQEPVMNLGTSLDPVEEVLDDETDFLEIQDEIENEKVTEELVNLTRLNPKRVSDLISSYVSEDRVEDELGAVQEEETFPDDGGSAPFDEDGDVLFDDDDTLDQDVFNESLEFQNNVVQEDVVS